MASVDVSGVSKHYGSEIALERIDLHAEDGEFVVLIGPSGCGKSTALRIIAGLDSASSGEISFGGERVDGLDPRQRNIAMVFQSYALYPQMTAEKNISFSLRLRSWAADKIDSAVGSASGMLGLNPYLNRYPRELSGGQRQRVAMGRALVRQPDVFLFDEPLSNLDAKLRGQMRFEIKALHQELKTTTIYVTHDQVEAMTLAQRIVVMNTGRVEQIGTPEDLYDRPRNTFVATFLGSPTMNLAKGCVTEDTVRLSDAELCAAPLSAPQGELMIGIRPEALELSDTGVPATVRLCEFTGSETLVHLETASGPLIVQTRDRARLSTGERIHVRAASNRVHIFDTDGNRIDPGG